MSNCEVHHKLPYRKSITTQNTLAENVSKRFSFLSKPCVISTLKYDSPIHPLPSPTFLSFKTFPCSSTTMSNEQYTLITDQCAVLSQQLKHVHRQHTLRVFHAELLCAQIACLFHGHRLSLHHDLPQSPQIYSGDAQLLLAVSVSFSSALSHNLGSQRNDSPRKPAEQAFNEKRQKLCCIFELEFSLFRRSVS